MQFRLCNRSSTYFVQTTPTLRTAFRIAPNSVKGRRAVQVWTHVTPKQLCQMLYRRKCDGCGRLAQCIYLPIRLRAYFECTHPRYCYYFSTPKTEDAILGHLLPPELVTARPTFSPLCGGGISVALNHPVAGTGKLEVSPAHKSQHQIFVR
jgi:hypothetical protein